MDWVGLAPCGGRRHTREWVYYIGADFRFCVVTILQNTRYNFVAHAQILIHV